MGIQNSAQFMKLYLVHCGFYDEEVSEGIYEFHVNLPVIAESLDAAKKNVRLNPTFQKKKMHIDGIQEIRKVDGFLITLREEPGATTQIDPIPYRDL